MCCSFATLSLHCCVAGVFALIGAVVLAVAPDADLGDVSDRYWATKTAAFLWAVPGAVGVYACSRECELRFNPTAAADGVNAWSIRRGTNIL